MQLMEGPFGMGQAGEEPRLRLLDVLDVTPRAQYAARHALFGAAIRVIPAGAEDSSAAVNAKPMVEKASRSPVDVSPARRTTRPT
jgi:hypothetical protein